MAGHPSRLLHMNTNPRAGPTDPSEHQGFIDHMETQFGLNVQHISSLSASIKSSGKLQEDTSSEESVPMQGHMNPIYGADSGMYSQESLAGSGMLVSHPPGTPQGARRITESATPLGMRRSSSNSTGTPQAMRKSPSGRLHMDSPQMSRSPSGGNNVARSPSEMSRSQSGGSNKTSNYSFGSNTSHVEPEDDMLLFVEPPSKKLFCPLCQTVFIDPVIVACGHTFCRRCVEVKSDGICPVDKIKLKIVVGNLAVGEQIGELYVHCRYGIKEEGDGLVVNPTGCPQTIRLNSKREHEEDCGYAPTQCPNNPNCTPLLKKDLEEHLLLCQHLKCEHSGYGCEFHGTADELENHLKTCHYEALKDYLSTTDLKISSLEQQLMQKDEKVDFLTNLLRNLNARVEQLEKNTDEKLDIFENKHETVLNEVIDLRRSYLQVNDDIAYLQRNQTGQVGAYDPQQIFKCKGTFVGHQGPVWCLTVYQDYLLSGSSDKSVKVWDTYNSMKCLKTLDGHEGIVLALCVSGNKLYTGSQDCNIIVWDLEEFEVEKKIVAHENPVCTLVSTRGQLFSGSLKVIKVWDLQTLELKKEITGLNHWVRALVAHEKYLYSGSYQTVKIWDLDTMTCIRDLDTSGGSVYSIAVTQYYIFCGTYENCIHVWEMDSYKQLTTLTGHSGTVYALAVLHTTSGTKVFSASYDRSLRVWSVDNMICTQTLQRHNGSVACLAVSRGCMFSGALDSNIKVWQ